MTEQNQTSLWMTKISNKVQALVHKLGLPNDMGQNIKELVFEVAREQFKAGNSNGIRWARTNPVPKATS